MDILSRNYTFYMALENSWCDEYVTEKLYMPLANFLIPVVWGGCYDSNQHYRLHSFCYLHKCYGYNYTSCNDRVIYKSLMAPFKDMCTFTQLFSQRKFFFQLQTIARFYPQIPTSTLEITTQSNWLSCWFNSGRILWRWAGASAQSLLEGGRPFALGLLCTFIHAYIYNYVNI